MTMSDHTIHPSAPSVVPRWEWRTFGDDLARRPRRPRTVADRGVRRERRDLPPVDARRRLRQGPRRRPGRQGPAAGERRRAAAVGADDEGPLPARCRSGRGRLRRARRATAGDPADRAQPGAAAGGPGRSARRPARRGDPQEPSPVARGRLHGRAHRGERRGKHHPNRRRGVPGPGPRVADDRPAGARRSAQRLRGQGAQVDARVGTEAVRRHRRRHQLGQVRARSPRRGWHPADRGGDRRGHQARRGPGGGRWADRRLDGPHGRRHRGPGRRRPTRGSARHRRRGHGGATTGIEPGRVPGGRPQPLRGHRGGHLGPGRGTARVHGRRVDPPADGRPTAGVRLRRRQQPVHLRERGPDRGAVQRRRGRRAVRRALRARGRRAPRDRRRGARRDRGRARRAGGPTAPGHGDRDRRHLHQPGSHQARPGPLRPGRRPRDRRRRGRGGPTDRGLPDSLCGTSGARSPACSRPGPR